MKKHAIIPIFIPHFGCPNDCVFCNQRTITARTEPVSAEDVEKIIEDYLGTLTGRGIETIEVAFFGGSFTGIPLPDQSSYLAVACDYKRRGLIDKIHLSTRPDYIDKVILDNLAKYDVDTIELGVQSFDPDVLIASKRGHTVSQVYDACSLIKSYGFELGIQLMIGLPGDTKEKAIASAQAAASIKPAIARLYPTVVLADTELSRMLSDGRYTALSEDNALDITKEMYKILQAAGINIIRVGLKSTDLITNSADLGGGYHPAFRQLVEGAIALEQMESQLAGLHSGTVTFASNQKSFPAMIGHKACNKKIIAEKYSDMKVSYMEDNTLSDYEYKLLVEQRKEN